MVLFSIFLRSFLDSPFSDRLLKGRHISFSFLVRRFQVDHLSLPLSSQHFLEAFSFKERPRSSRMKSPNDVITSPTSFFKTPPCLWLFLSTPPKLFYPWGLFQTHHLLWDPLFRLYPSLPYFSPNPPKRPPLWDVREEDLPLTPPACSSLLPRLLETSLLEFRGFLESWDPSLLEKVGPLI